MHVKQLQKPTKMCCNTTIHILHKTSSQTMLMIMMIQIPKVSKKILRIPSVIYTWFYTGFYIFDDDGFLLFS